MHPPQEILDIRREMAAVRCDLYDDLKGVFHTSRDMVDWRYYVREYAWPCMAAAATIGYLAVPSRIETIAPDADDLAELARRRRLVVKPQVVERLRSGLRGGLVNFVSHIAVQAAVAYLGSRPTR